MFKLGYIDYLNCYPFYHHILTQEPLTDVSIFPAHPEELNVLMSHGQLDMSPISAAAYADIQDAVHIVPDFCLSSVGYVKSVLLRSSLPIELLDGKTIGLTKASRTSVILLKILLHKYYGISPLYVQVDVNPYLDSVDAALVIGNQALLEEKVPALFSFDLGDLWLHHTGFPVVFAVFAVQNSAFAKFPACVRAVIDSYYKSLYLYKHHTDAVIAHARARYPQVVYDIRSYYNVLQFEFSEDLKKALLFYYSEAHSLGLLQKVDSLGLI